MPTLAEETAPQVDVPPAPAEPPKNLWIFQPGAPSTAGIRAAASASPLMNRDATPTP